MPGRDLPAGTGPVRQRIAPFVPVRYLQFDYAELRKFGSPAVRCVRLKNWSFTSDSTRDDTDSHRPEA
jgi:hypothetical protein